MKKLKFKWFYINSFIIYSVLVFVFSILTLIFLEQFAYSFLVSTFGAEKYGSTDVLEIVVDERSMQEHGKSWTKGDYADILAFLSDYAKPKIIGFDATINSFKPSNPEDIKLLNQVHKMDNLVSGFLPEKINDNSDNELLKMFKKTQALDVTLKRSTPESVYNGIRSSSDYMMSKTKNYGSVLVNTSANNGYMFASSNIIQIDDAFYPSLSLKMYLLEHNTNEVVIDSSNIIIPKTGLKIPYLYKKEGIFNSNLRYYKNYTSDYSHIPIPAYAITDTYKALKSGINPENSPKLFAAGGKYINPVEFNGKTVLIGSNISGPTADVLLTPMSKRHPGVDIQATAYDNLSNNYFSNHAGFGVAFLSFVILAIFTFVFILKNKFLNGLLLIALMNIVYLSIVAISARNGYMMTYSVPLVAQFVTTVFGYSFKFISENRNKEKIKQAMGKYLSQDIMKNVVKNIDDLKLGGKRAVVTVLFSDIRGFTSLSEKMSAEEVSMILNEYFSEMEPIITKYNGVINKFIGDAVMAIFGEPIQDSNHAQNSVKCAYEMLKKVEYLREKWLYEGKPKIEIGVGINTGEVFIGNIGTETRMEYTVIGDTVNLASRIESYNKVYKTNLLVSSSTYEAIADIADVIKISEVQIRGKAKKMNIYEVLRIDRTEK